MSKGRDGIKGKDNLCANSIGSVSGTCMKEQREVNS